jgi:hypothetical protein
MGQVAKALDVAGRGSGQPGAVPRSGKDGGVNGLATGRAGRRRHYYAPELRLAALLLAAAHMWTIVLPQALAQSSAQPALAVPPTIAAEPATQAAFPILVGPAPAVPRNSFVRLRGLPPMAALSEGHSISPGAWAVSLAALPTLKIVLPAGSTGRSDIVVTLVAIDGSVLAEAESALTVAAAAQPSEKNQALRGMGPPAIATMLRAGVAEGPDKSAQPDPPATRAATLQDRERALRLLKKGEEQLAEGNVSAARLFYERAADAGLAQGAMALASTFDAAELVRLRVRGIPPDVKQARRWYERARQLGAGDAEERLRRIGTN